MSGAQKYQSTIDRKNKNNSHSLAIDFIEGNHQGHPLRILEVGCSTGYFGSALKRLGHFVCGVEMDENSAKMAKDLLDEVHCCTIQEYFESHPGEIFDVITFGDVLEHLADPASVLASTRKHLTSEGRVIASIPNVTHASIRCMMLQGDWIYGDLGILDRTHLRFFTKESIFELFEASGFSISNIQAVKLTAQQAAGMCGLNLNSEKLKIVESIEGDDSAENFQYVISAKKFFGNNSIVRKVAVKKRSLRILAACDDKNSTITNIRLTEPLQGFANEGCRSLRVVNFHMAAAGDVEWADVVIIQRGANNYANGLCEMARQAGKPIVYEIDDLLTDLPDFLDHHQGYVQNKNIIEGMIRCATLVTLTNQNLKSALSHLNQSAMICPNYSSVQSSVIPPCHDPSANAVVNLIIASSDRVRVDMVSPALVAIKKKYQGRVLIHAIGPIAETLHDLGVECEGRSLISREDFVPTVGRYKNAIGIIPLDNSKFSSCKSPVKYFDYSQAGLVSICSNVSPYKDVIDNGITGMLCGETEDWVEKLTRLIEEPEFRLRVALNAQLHVKENYGLQKAIDAWTAVFHQLAPGDEAIRLSPALPPKPSLLEKVVNFVKKKNRRRKARRAHHRQQKLKAATPASN